MGSRIFTALAPYARYAVALKKLSLPWWAYTSILQAHTQNPDMDARTDRRCESYIEEDQRIVDRRPSEFLSRLADGRFARRIRHSAAQCRQVGQASTLTR